MKKKIIVIGAGAAGMIAAGRAAESGADVLILEKMERAGRKLLITGKGRCNITNIAPMSEFIRHIYPEGKFLRPAFSQFFSKDIIRLLEAYGVETKAERGGRVFPFSDFAADIVNGLLKWNHKAGVKTEYGCRVTKILAENNQVKAVQYEKNGGMFRIPCEAVILCSGGKSYPATGSDGSGYRLAEMCGHRIIFPLPSLVPLTTETSLAASMQGVSLKNIRASLFIENKKQADEFGEMLFTHFGLSGPVILTLSRLAVEALESKKDVIIYIDLKPALDDKVLDQRLLRDLNEFGKKSLRNIFREWLPQGMIMPFIELCGLEAEKKGHQVSAEERKRIRVLMKNLKFRVNGHRGFKEAIITSGGVSLDEINPESMESERVKGLYFAGEVINLHADTGGYNLQIAWSTGWLAGTHSASAH
ncbi:MAG TPA: NAD(P)/FAD-dependent oxidoreductase [Bacteroidia bacterium]|nr:NAD(P)/FAD-dependent oxidoreductase [Bacteroidia bacterium]HRS59842.1 NAD(P)/FAD-dependent oxidoreductase [Bacteroidia bacterium]HRU68906.1 NAD(P)/FAD-dependent oxidoreductase [Bacteroidia bacterium]